MISAFARFVFVGSCASNTYTSGSTVGLNLPAVSKTCGEHSRASSPFSWEPPTLNPSVVR